MLTTLDKESTRKGPFIPFRYINNTEKTIIRIYRYVCFRVFSSIFLSYTKAFIHGQCQGKRIDTAFVLGEKYVNLSY